MTHLFSPDKYLFDPNNHIMVTYSYSQDGRSRETDWLPLPKKQMELWLLTTALARSPEVVELSTVSNGVRKHIKEER